MAAGADADGGGAFRRGVTGRSSECPSSCQRSGRTPNWRSVLTLAVGFVIGRVRVGTFTLGNVVGTLLAGVVIGQLDIKVDPLVKVVFFDLFLFATGYKVGPQFFRGLKKHAGPQVALTVVLCVTSLLTTVAAAKIFDYDSGTAAGLMEAKRWVAFL